MTLGSIPEGWLLHEGRLARDFVFPDFAAAFAFMAAVASVAEAAGHHPDWCNSWNKVSITLFSHDVGRITDRDTDLATRINSLL